MAAVREMLILALCGLLHTVTSQTVAPGTAPGSSGIKADVTATVMALLNETGYSGKPTDPNVQEIVAMLMNGTVPTDADLIRLGIVTQRPGPPSSTPPPYTIPGRPTGLDPSLTLASIGQQSAVQTGTLSSSNPFSSFPGTSTGTQAGTSGASTNPFSTGNSANVLALFNLGSLAAGPLTTLKPILGDPFSMAGTGPTFQTMAALDPNALGPKPFVSVDPIGGLGTPGSPTDLLGSMAQGGLGAGGMEQAGLGTGMPLQTGIMDTPMRQPPQQSNPMPMMMMMNPELMEGMMAENPMMAYIMMQQLNRPRPRPQPAAPMYPSVDMGGMGGFGGAAGSSPAGMMSPTAGGAGGMMDLMGAGSGGSLGMTGMGGQGMTGLDALGAGGSMGLNQGSLSAGGASPGVTDLRSLLNMGNPGMAGAGASAMMDPMLAPVG